MTANLGTNDLGIETIIGPGGVLVAALVAHGVGRLAARKLAQEKPEVCQLHLDAYMPYLDAGVPADPTFPFSGYGNRST